MPTLPSKKYKFKPTHTVIRDKLVKNNPLLTDKHLSNLRYVYNAQELNQGIFTIKAINNYFLIPNEVFTIGNTPITIADILDEIGISRTDYYSVNDKDTILSLLPDGLMGRYDQVNAILTIEFDAGSIPLEFVTGILDNYEIDLTMPDDEMYSFNSVAMLVNSPTVELRLLPNVGDFNALMTTHGFSSSKPLKLKTLGDIIEEIPTS